MTGSEAELIAEVLNSDSYFFNSYAVPNGIAALLSLVVGLKGLVQSQGNRTGQLFFLLGFSCTLWLGSRALIYSSTSASVAQWWSAWYLIVMPATAGCILHLTTDFLNITRRLIALVWLNWLLSCVVIALQLRLNLLLDNVAQMDYGYIALTSGAGNLASAWLGCVSLGSAALSARALLAAPSGSLLRRRLLLLTAALFFICLAGMDGLASPASNLYQPGWLFVIAALTLFAVMLSKYGLVDSKPAFAAAHIIDRIDSPMLVIDIAGRIRMANRAAAELANAPLDALPGMSVTTALPELLSEALLSELRADNKKYRREVSYAAANGNVVEFQLMVSPLFTERAAYTSDNPGFVVSLNDVSQLKSAEADLRYLSLHDSLTGLANRRQFANELNNRFDDFLATGRAFTLVFIDLDKFKPVNDQYGHQAGDELLSIIAQKLIRLTHPQDLCARLGGDEFAIIARTVVSTGDVAALLERLKTSLNQPVQLSDNLLSVTASIGHVQPNRGKHANAEQLLHDADQAMYRAKHGDRAAPHRAIIAAAG